MLAREQGKTWAALERATLSSRPSRLLSLLLRAHPNVGNVSKNGPKYVSNVTLCGAKVAAHAPRGGILLSPAPLLRAGCSLVSTKPGPLLLLLVLNLSLR